MYILSLPTDHKLLVLHEEVVANSTRSIQGNRYVLVMMLTALLQTTLQHCMHPMETVDLRTLQEGALEVRTRADCCSLPRACVSVRTQYKQEQLVSSILSFLFTSSQQSVAEEAL